MNFFHLINLVLILLLSSHNPEAAPVFGHLAEGFTSPDRDTGITAAQRMFSVPDFPETCSPLQAPNRLIVVNTEPLQLVSGRWFPYEFMVVVAVDASGAVLPPVPIVIDVEDINPPVLNLRSDMTAFGKVLPIRTGKFSIRFTALCDGHSAFTIIDAEVVNAQGSSD